MRMNVRADIGFAAIGLLMIVTAVAGFAHDADAGVENQRGIASWYGPGFHGKKTASGKTFDQFAMTAAHRKLPLGTQVVVTNLHNGRTVEVEINDRGPYVQGRIIDLSKAAAQKLKLTEAGIAPVRIEVIGDRGAAGSRPLVASRDGNL